MAGAPAVPGGAQSDAPRISRGPVVRLCAVASLASILVRVGRFKTMLLREERTINQRFVLALCSPAFSVGRFYPAGRAVLPGG